MLQHSASSATRLSISTRLALSYGLTLLLLLSIFAVFCYSNYHFSVHRDFDRHLTHEQRELAPFVRMEAGTLSFVSLDQLRSVAYQTDGVYGTYVRLLSATGAELYRSPNFEGHDNLPASLESNDMADVREFAVSHIWEGSPSRTHYTPFTLENGTLGGWLEITGMEWSAHRELARLARALVVGTLLSVLLAIAAGFVLARRALKPVASLTYAANRITASDLSARLPMAVGTRDELTDLAETLNGLIGRLEASFTRERRFSSNAAHELLTPLTTMRSGVEVVLRKRRESERYERALREVLQDIDTMSESVRGLLALAQAERLAELPRDRVNLSNLVRQRIPRFEDRAATENVELQMHIQPSVFATGHTTHLAEIVDNLIDNAIKYTPQGGRIVVEVEGDKRESRIRVSDSGIGFKSEEQGLLFDRFYRADSAEVQAQPGSGLGLTVAEVIANAYGGTISARSDGLHSGATFEVCLPSPPGGEIRPH